MPTRLADMDYLPIPCPIPKQWTLAPRVESNPVAYAAPLPARTLGTLKPTTRAVFREPLGWKVCGWVNAALLAVLLAAVAAGASWMPGAGL